MPKTAISKGMKKELLWDSQREHTEKGWGDASKDGYLPIQTQKVVKIKHIDARSNGTSVSDGVWKCECKICPSPMKGKRPRCKLKCHNRKIFTPNSSKKFFLFVLGLYSNQPRVV